VKHAIPGVSALRMGLGLLVALLLSGAGAAGQTLTIPELSRAREDAARKKSLTEIEKRQILELYDKAVKSVEGSLRFRAAQLGQERAMVIMRSELAALQEEIQRGVPAPPGPPRADESLREVEDELVQTITDRNTRQKTIANLPIVAAELVKRQDEISLRRADLRQKLENADDQLAVVKLTSVSPEWAMAARTQLLALKQELAAEAESLEAERQTLDLRRALVPLQRESTRLRLESAERYLPMLKERGKAARQREAARQAERSLQVAHEAEAAFPVLGTVAREVEDLVSGLWGPDGAHATTQEITEASAWMRESSVRLEQAAASIKRRYRSAGTFSPANEWLEQLPKNTTFPKDIQRTRLRGLWLPAMVRREIIALEERRAADTTLETELADLKSSVTGMSAADLARFESQARALLQLRLNLIEDLLRANQDLAGQLAEFNDVTAGLVRRFQDLVEFVWARILWARSTTVGPALTPTTLLDGARWLFLNPGWAGIVPSIFSSNTAVIFSLLSLLFVILLFVGRPRFRKALEKVSSGQATPLAGGFRVLGLSLFWTALIAAGAPAALAWLHFIVGIEDSPWSRALASGLLHASILLFVLLLLRAALAEGGLAATQFGVSGAACATVTRELRWLIPVLPSLWFVVEALDQVGGLLYEELRLRVLNNTVGRAFFIAVLLILLVACRRVLHPRSPLASAGGDPRGRMNRLRKKLLSRSVISFVIVALVILAIAGFFLTSLVLAQNLAATALLTAGWGLCSALIKRWWQEQKGVISPGAGAPDRDRESIRSQVRQLIRFALSIAWIAGALLIWASAMPALTLSRQVQVLPVVRFIDSEEAASPEKSAPETPAGLEQASRPAAATAPAPAPAKPDAGTKTPAASAPLFLSDILKAIGIGILAIIFVKNLPGLLDFLAFHRFDLDAGARYAISTIARYSFTILGVFAVSSALGISWTQVQWLAAAMTFGIGFGLQEIFANFASGLILLLDRSLRVGDAVSVGEFSGQVARIRMRATTITLWDRSEMVVPNKDFVTGKLVNWTLSYPESRVDVKVGVAYDSDINLVRRILLEIASANPNVMKVPPPEVFLMEFADSAVKFELRVFCLFSYGRLVLLNELHTAVFHEFRKHGIVIAFPQLDVHLNPDQVE
jgi:potassium-dependent mechanosensitive channel